MKNIFTYVLTTIMVFSLSACDSVKSPQSDSVSGIVTPSESSSMGGSDNGSQGENEVDGMEVSERTPLQEVTYFWEEGNMPTTSVYPENSSNYFDPADFRPNMVFYPAKEGVEVKGAVMICAGGAFQVRAASDEAPVAQGLNELGYHCFVVKYRLQPYTMQEGALDLARAVRYVRSYAEDLGMDENNIAVIGFSAGGILCGELLLNFDGLVKGRYFVAKSHCP